jgi:hypothetical protein
MAANEPRTFEGAQVWDLMKRCGHQLRLASGMGGSRVLGIDMNAVMAMGAALHVDPWIVAEIAPDLETAMVRGMNDQQQG